MPIHHWLRRRSSGTDGAAAAAGASPAHLIDLAGVVKAYDTAAGSFVALRGIDLAIDAGEFVAVIGKSGSGKSTLLNVIAGIDRPSAGTVHVGGTPIHALSENDLAAWRGHSLGVVFQFFQLMPTLTAIENVMLPMDFGGVYAPRERADRARLLLDQVGLAEQADKLPATLSGGEQQRVAIARALACDPPVLVADEPTGNLDTHTTAAILDLFDGLVAGGKTIVIVTHDPDVAERCTRVLTISDGQLVGDLRDAEEAPSHGVDDGPRSAPATAVEADAADNTAAASGSPQPAAP
jgi:putative ABC transport system ATP-binding protein